MLATNIVSSAYLRFLIIESVELSVNTRTTRALTLWNRADKSQPSLKLNILFVPCQASVRYYDLATLPRMTHDSESFKLALRCAPDVQRL